MPDQSQLDRERQDKERQQKDRQFQDQSDAEIQRITVTIDKLKVDLPADKRGEMDGLKQAIQSLVAHYKQHQATQLPADPNAPKPVNPMAPGGQPQPK